ncbi:hypothetical protein M9Y10_039565 [Tritrichomonas musculus]|uniref:Uncharacterized protein n=1 Tax=Tritrichomonas musculus TaxID=1915356 RepID=A0ABR2KCM0_9EUKA
MLGLFGSPFGSVFSNPFEPAWTPAGARMLNLINTLLNDDDEFGFSSQEDEHPKKKGKKEEPPKETETTKEFSSIKQSFFNGPHMIEETRESRIDSRTGESREVTTRRLGNRWFQRESVTDKDGNKTTNERWHNVSPEQEEDFKKKWEEHRGDFGFGPLKDESNTKALKHEK